jgi:hypothetical protein
MATPTAAEVKAYAEKFSGLTDVKVGLFIESASLWVNETKWGRKHKMGMILMACHLLEVDQRSGAGGAIASESVGELSVSYNLGSKADSELDDTSFGRQFKSLRKTLGITPIVL